MGITGGGGGVGSGKRSGAVGGAGGEGRARCEGKERLWGGVGLEGKKGDFGGEIKDILGEKGILGGGE